MCEYNRPYPMPYGIHPDDRAEISAELHRLRQQNSVTVFDARPSGDGLCSIVDNLGVRCNRTGTNAVAVPSPTGEIYVKVCAEHTAAVAQ